MSRKRTIKAAELFEPIDIDLFGTTFALRPPTKSTEEAQAAKEVELRDAFKKVEEEDLDEAEARKLVMPIYYDLFEIILEPSEGEGGKKTHAKTVIKKLYEDDTPGFGFTGIQKLIGEIGEVRNDEQRPT